MKIHAVYGWDFPATGASGAGSTRLPNGPWQAYTSNAETTTSVSTSASGVVSMSIVARQYNFGNYRFKIQADLKEMVANLSPTSNLYIGLSLTVGTGFTGSNLFGFTSDVDMGNALALLSTGIIPGFVINKAYFFECNLDFAAGVIRRRLDGKALPSVTMPAWMLTAVGATPGSTSVFAAIGAIQVNYSIQNGETHFFSWSDFYCVEWESGEVPQFLGPVKVAKVPIAAVSAPAWTPSTGTPTSVLQTGYRPNIAITAPTVTSDDPMSQAAITFDTSSLPQGIALLGVAVKGRSAVSAASTGKLGVSLTSGGVETPDTDVAMVAAQTFYDRMYSSSKSPAGLAWTLPSLAGLTVKAKPKV